MCVNWTYVAGSAAMDQICNWGNWEWCYNRSAQRICLEDTKEWKGSLFQYYLNLCSRSELPVFRFSVRFVKCCISDNPHNFLCGLSLSMKLKEIKLLMVDPIWIFDVRLFLAMVMEFYVRQIHVTHVKGSSPWSIYLRIRFSNWCV
jgi:hypothetical protein